MSFVDSAAVADALYSRETVAGVHLLATITIGESPTETVLRFVDNPVDVVSNGNTYTGFPFQIVLSCDADRPPQIQIQIANIDRQITEALEDSQVLDVGAPQFQIDVVLISDPDTVVRSFPSFKLQDMVVDAMTITATLAQDRISNEQWPSIRATRTRCPSLF